jgi:hypothetical protein
LILYSLLVAAAGKKETVAGFRADGSVWVASSAELFGVNLFGKRGLAYQKS